MPWESFLTAQTFCAFGSIKAGWITEIGVRFFVGVVPLVKIIVVWGLYWGPPNFGKGPFFASLGTGNLCKVEGARDHAWRVRGT